MTVRPAGRRLAAAVALLALGGACTQAPGDRASQAALRYSVSEGESENHFIRQDGIAAHLNLRTQPAPRLVSSWPRCAAMMAGCCTRGAMAQLN